MQGAYAPVRTSAPAAMPVSLAEAKDHLRVDHADDDTLIGLLIAAATSELDGWSGILGRAIVTQAWAQRVDGFANPVRLPFPAATIASVSYVDPAGATQTLASDQYRLMEDAMGSYIEPAFNVSWPSVRYQSGSVTVNFTAGTAAADVPPAIKAAILLRVGDLYANRDVGIEENPAIKALVTPFRRIRV